MNAHTWNWRDIACHCESPTPSGPPPRSGAPLLPMAYYGGESFRQNIARLRRTDFHIVVGQPFYLDAGGVKMTRVVRQQMVDEIMYQVAALLPPAYRGHYSNLDVATEQYLRFPASSESNLHRERSEGRCRMSRFIRRPPPTSPCPRYRFTPGLRGLSARGQGVWG